MDNIGSTLFIFLLLLVCSAFFSSSETALTKANKVRLKNQEEQGSKAAGRALLQNTDMSATEIADKALHIAAEICVYTNSNIIVETV